jgi:hypothetical protein
VNPSREPECTRALTPALALAVALKVTANHRPIQPLWGAACCATNLTTLADYSDANATKSSVLAGLQLCFDHAVLVDEYTNARLSNSQCITAWATLCARDDILGDWMQEKVRSEPDLPTDPL